MKREIQYASAFQWLRLGLGVMLSLHGVTKLLAGRKEWIHLGEQLERLIQMDLPALELGLIASIVQAACGLLIAVGWFCRLAIVAYFPIMVVAFVTLVNEREPFAHYSHSLEIMMILAAFYFIGPGEPLFQPSIEKPK